jgi:hypothetical protein
MLQTAQSHVDRAQRFPLSIPLRYRKNGMPHWQDGRTINISRTGILFQTDETIPTSSVLDIRISFPLDGTLSCQGLIVRAGESQIAVKIHRYHLLHEDKTNATD